MTPRYYLLVLLMAFLGSTVAEAKEFCDPRQPYTDYDGDPVFAADCELHADAARKIKLHYPAWQKLDPICPLPGVTRIDADAKGSITLVCRKGSAFGVFEGRYWKTCPGSQDTLEVTGIYTDGLRSGRWETFDCATGRRLRVEHFEKDMAKGSRILWKPDGKLDKVERP